ncbi:peptidase [Scytonema hofmannii PCC 7110]|uniref:Peptidase n=1 Tax=Scytonema hofmannii PCC 7110 TaxID=128403 RepID=A0A139WTX5_9CYAN|nr:PPC domain-containing protein [Scytonema hofmannii]KYC35882.1 peptidase [Scytonema hofmannii PCC 7110]
MVEKSNKQCANKLKLALIGCMSSSLLITNYAFPIKVLANVLHSKPFLIAKPADERQPAAVEKGIEQIPIAQQPVPRQVKQPIESPLPAGVSSGSVNSTPKSNPSETSTASKPNVSTTPTQPSNTSTTSTPSGTGVSIPVPSPSGDRSTPSRQGNSTPSRQGNSTPSRQGNSTPSRQGNSTPSRQGNSKPSRQGNSKPSRQGNSTPTTAATSSVSLSKTPEFQEINFVDIAFGVLAPGDYQSQGRYYHFYQFEGRENQLVQIRLSGSADRRRTNNLNLDPFMFLLDPDNNVLLTRGNEEVNPQGVKDAFIFVRLPRTGTYTIAVTSRKPGDTGRYSLALRNDRASYSLDRSDELTQESRIQRKSGSPYNISKFQGKKDQLVSIRADSVFEQFSPYIVLLNSQGQIVATDDNKDGRYSAFIDRAKLPEDGTYYVVVISANSRERGTYRLTVF